MKQIHRAPLAILLAFSLLSATACSGEQAPASSAANPVTVSSEAAAEPSSAEPIASSASVESTLPAEPEEPTLEEPEAVETIGGMEAGLTGVVTGEIQQTISGITGSRAGTAAERDALAKQLAALKPGALSLIIVGDPLSGYADQTLLSDEDSKALVGLAAALPAPGVFTTLDNPTTGGFLWTLYIEAGDQAMLLSDDGSWLTAIIKGQTQALVFDSAPCKAGSEKISSFVAGQITTAQGNILTLP